MEAWDLVRPEKVMMFVRVGLDAQSKWNAFREVKESEYDSMYSATLLDVLADTRVFKKALESEDLSRGSAYCVKRVVGKAPTDAEMQHLVPFGDTDTLGSKFADLSEDAQNRIFVLFDFGGKVQTEDAAHLSPETEYKVEQTDRLDALESAFFLEKAESERRHKEQLQALVEAVKLEFKAKESALKESLVRQEALNELLTVDLKAMKEQVSALTRPALTASDAVAFDFAQLNEEIADIKRQLSNSFVRPTELMELLQMQESINQALSLEIQQLKDQMAVLLRQPHHVYHQPSGAIVNRQPGTVATAPPPPPTYPRGNTAVANNNTNRNVVGATRALENGGMGESSCCAIMARKAMTLDHFRRQRIVNNNKNSGWTH